MRPPPSDPGDPSARPVEAGSDASAGGLEPATRDFYRTMLERLNASGVPFLVGGAYALHRFAGIERHTKDLDLFIREEDRDRIFAVLDGAGCRTELTFSHWLGKARRGGRFLDVIFNSGNGLGSVDEAWFARSVPEEVMGVPVRLCPPEEMIWQKAFIMERERFDGADVAHLILAQAHGLDWSHLLERFGSHFRVLLAHLILFGYIFPSRRGLIPSWVLDDLLRRLGEEPESSAASGSVCFGTFLSRAQYLVDVQDRGDRDARLGPEGPMTSVEVARWTEAIDDPSA